MKEYHIVAVGVFPPRRGFIHLEIAAVSAEALMKHGIASITNYSRNMTSCKTDTQFCISSSIPLLIESGREITCH